MINKNPDEIVHVSRMQQEILLQLMIKMDIFKDVKVGELRNFVIIAITRITNYEHIYKNSPHNQKLLADKNFNELDFIIDILAQT